MVLDRYRAFYQVAADGSFSKAAEALFITQPALSRAVQKLEQNLGCVLFFRLPRGVRLTQEGQVLFDHIRQAYQWIDRGERTLAAMKQLDQGEVRIGASEVLCRHFLLPVLERFQRRYPGIGLHVRNGTSRETSTWLVEGVIDFGLVNLPLDDDRVRVEAGPTLNDCFVVGPSRREFAHASVPLKALAGTPIICLEAGSVSRDHLVRFFRGQGLDLNPEIELGNLDLVVDFARRGLGVGVAVREFLQNALASGELFEVVTEPSLPPRPIGLIRMPDYETSLAARAFLAEWRWD